MNGTAKANARNDVVGKPASSVEDRRPPAFTAMSAIGKIKRWNDARRLAGGPQNRTPRDRANLRPGAAQSFLTATPLLDGLGLFHRAFERAPGLGEEDVVEGRRAQLDVRDVDAVCVDRSHDVGEPEPASQPYRDVPRRRERLAELSQELGDARPVFLAMRDRMHARSADLGLELGRRSLGHDLPLVDDPHTVGEDVGLLEVLGREEDRHSVLSPQAGDLFPERRPALRVETRGRLVEEQDARPVNQRQREVEPSLHASRVAGDLAVACVGEPDALEEIVRASASLILPHALERRLEAEVVPPGQERIERGFLEGDTDQRAHLRPFLDHVVAPDAGRPGGRRQQRRQDVDGRGLAGAVRSEEAVDLAWCNRKIDPVDCARPLLVLADEPLDLYSVVLVLHAINTTRPFSRGRLDGRRKLSRRRRGGDQGAWCRAPQSREAVQTSNVARPSARQPCKEGVAQEHQADEE